MAEILWFPRERDSRFVWRQASWLAEMPMQAAEKQLAQQLKIQRETALRRGIAADLVPVHIARIEAAIRDALFQIAASSGGVA